MLYELIIVSSAINKTGALPQIQILNPRLWKHNTKILISQLNYSTHTKVSTYLISSSIVSGCSFFCFVDFFFLSRSLKLLLPPFLSQSTRNITWINHYEQNGVEHFIKKGLTDNDDDLSANQLNIYQVHSLSYRKLKKRSKYIESEFYQLMN